MNTFYAGSSIFEVINIGKIIVSVSIILLFLSLSLYAYYSKKGVNKKKSTSLDILIDRVLFLFFILAIWKGKDNDLINILSKFDNPVFVILIFAIALLLYFISYLISLRLYRNKEF